MKYLSLNIWFGGKLWEELVAFLRREDADVAALQEVYNGKDPALPPNLRSFDALGEALRYKHRAFAPAFRDANFGNIELGQAVFSKFPIESNETIWFDQPFDKIASSNIEDAEFAPRSLQLFTIRANGKVIRGFNTHGIWGRDGADNPRRLAMVDTVLEQMRGKQNIVLSGDFNFQHTTQAAQKLRAGLKDIFENELTCSFNLQQKTDPRFATLVVDMLFVSPEIKLIEKHCPQVNVSDHLPLIVVLEI